MLAEAYRILFPIRKEDFIDLLTKENGLAKSKALKDELDNLMTASKRAISFRDSNKASLLLAASWEVVKGIGPFVIVKAPSEKLLQMESTEQDIKLRLYYILSEYYWMIDDLDQVHKIVDEALKISTSINDLKGEVVFKFTKSRAYMKSGDTELGTSYCEQSLEIARQLGDSSTEINALSNMGVILAMQGKMKEGEVMQHKALEISKRIGNVLLESKVLERFAAIYNNSGEAELAKQTIEKFYNIALALGDQNMEVRALFFKCFSLNVSGEYEEGQKCAEKGILIAREMGKKIDEAYLLIQLGIYLSKQGNDNAQEYFENAKAIFQKMKVDVWGECSAYNALGIYYAGSKEYSLAESNYQKALHLSTKIGMKSMEGASRNGLGNVLILQGNYVQALKYLNEAVEIWEQTDWPAGKGYTYRFLGNLFAKQGEYEKAYNYYEKGKKELSNGNLYYLTELLLDFVAAAVENDDRDIARVNFDAAIDLVSNMQLGEKALLRKEISRLGELLTN